MLALNSGENPTTLAAFVCIYSPCYQVSRLANIVNLYLQSPDIIPLDQVQANPVQLVSTYNDFVAHTIDLDEPITSVYIRGKQSIGSQAVAIPTRVSLRAVPNELILWPQVWETADVIGHTELDYTGYKQGNGSFFFFSFNKFKGLSTQNFRFQWSSAVHQFSTLLFRLKKVTVTLLSLLLVQPQM